jgi:hypothetical protein
MFLVLLTQFQSQYPCLCCYEKLSFFDTLPKRLNSVKPFNTAADGYRLSIVCHLFKENRDFAAATGSHPVADQACGNRWRWLLWWLDV